MTDVPQEGFYFRDSDHSYFMDGRKMSGVTTILGVISKQQLIPWAARMAADHIGDNLEALIAGTPEERKAILDAAKNAHAKKRDAGADKGTDLHAMVENFVKSCILSGHDGKPNAMYHTDIKSFVEWAQKNNITFLASEKQLFSRSLFVAGTCDLVFQKDGKTYIGDIKTYKKLWDRTPMFQCAGYGLMHREMYGTDIDGYCVLRLSEDGGFEERWSFAVEEDTEAFLSAVKLYRALSNWK